MNTKSEDYFKRGKWKAPDIIPLANGKLFYFNQHGKLVVVDEKEYQQSLKDKGLA